MPPPAGCGRAPFGRRGPGAGNGPPACDAAPRRRYGVRGPAAPLPAAAAPPAGLPASPAAEPAASVAAVARPLRPAGRNACAIGWTPPGIPAGACAAAPVVVGRGTDAVALSPIRTSMAPNAAAGDGADPARDSTDDAARGDAARGDAADDGVSRVGAAWSVIPSLQQAPGHGTPAAGPCGTAGFPGPSLSPPAFPAGPNVPGRPSLPVWERLARQHQRSPGAGTVPA